MFKEEIDLANFARKHNIKVSIFDVFNQKHPLLDKEMPFLKIRISRGRKSFLVLRNKYSIFPDGENELLSADELTAAVLDSLQKFEPFPFEEYCREFFGETSDTPVEKIKKVYDIETIEYQQVIRLFPDILDELIEIIHG